MSSNQVDLCPEATFFGQPHEWRTVCATGGGLLRQCDCCQRVEWSNGRADFDAARAEFRDADVRPDFHWDKKPVAAMGYR